MKIHIEYDAPDERESALNALRADDVMISLNNIDNTMRAWLKHGHKFDNADDAILAIRDMLNEEINLFE